LGWPRDHEGQNGRDIDQGEKNERLKDSHRGDENKAYQEAAQEGSQEINRVNQTCNSANARLLCEEKTIGKGEVGAANKACRQTHKRKSFSV
jgi:hypothetical protein